MRLSKIAIPATALIAAAMLCILAAVVALNMVEESSRTSVKDALSQGELDWAEVDVNGLQVFLIGEAPDEAQRFRAVTLAGTAVDSARVIDQMLVAEAADIQPPRFSVETSPVICIAASPSSVPKVKVPVDTPPITWSVKKRQRAAASPVKSSMVMSRACKAAGRAIRSAKAPRRVNRSIMACDLASAGQVSTRCAMPGAAAEILENFGPFSSRKTTALPPVGRKLPMGRSDDRP